MIISTADIEAIRSHRRGSMKRVYLTALACAIAPMVQAATIEAIYLEYDELGRPIKVSGNNGQSMRYIYDANGNITSVTDAQGRQSSIQYDALNRPNIAINAANKSTTIVHDGNDTVVQVTDPRGLSTHYVKDGFGQTWSQSSPDTGTTTFEYDAAGLRTKLRRNDGSELSFSYDGLGRLTSQTGGGETRTYGYDWCGHGIGRLCGAEGQGTIHFGYKPDGRLAVTRELWGGHDDWMLYDYDGFGRLSGVNYGGAYANYSYTSGQVSGVYLYDGTTNHPIATNILHRPYGGIESWTYGNGLTRRYNRDLDGRVTGISVGDAQSITQSLTYAYNTSNEITAITNGIDASMNQNFGYDPMSRLTSVTSSKSEDITYDSNGNRTLTNWIAPIYNVVDSASNRINSDYNSAPGAGISYTHDARGNRSSQSWNGSTATFSYDSFNRLRSLARTADTTYLSPGYIMSTYPAGATTYSVNALDQRVAKSGPLGTHRFVYGGAGNKLLSEYTGGAWQRYVWLGDEPIALQRNNSLYFIHNDHLSRPELVTDSAKTVQWRAKNYHSDRGVVVDNIGGLNLGFPGQYFDAESGLWHNGFRDYDSRLGRYIQSDPIGLGGGINTYAYVGGNPIMLADPLGLEAPFSGNNGGHRMSWEGGTPPPDYVSVNLNLGVANLNTTMTRSGTLYAGGGLVAEPRPGIKSLQSVGFSITVGRVECPTHDGEATAAEVDSFVNGETRTISAFYGGVGGGRGWNDSGKSIEVGVGTPGASATRSIVRPVTRIPISW